MIFGDARPHSIYTPNFRNGDVDITLVEMMPQMMTGVCQPNRSVAMEALRHHGAKMFVNSKVMELNEYTIQVNAGGKVNDVVKHDVKIQHLEDGSEEWLKCFDYVILGLGSRKYDPLSEELKAFVPEVYVIGDAVKPGQSSDAMHQGFHVAYDL